MNTEYAVGNFCIRFESRARRRWFVALLYAVLAVFDLAMCYLTAKATAGAWLIRVVLILVILFGGFSVVLSWIAGDMRARDDEREMHRRDHAHYLAYYSLFYFLVGEFIVGNYHGPNPITPLLPLALRALLAQLPFFLFLATFFLYATLPRAILLWTEPDMEEEPRG